MKELSFFNKSFQNSFKDLVYYRILGCQNLWYYNGSPLNMRQNLKKRSLLFRSEVGIFMISFKILCKESFVDLEILIGNFKLALLFPQHDGPLKFLRNNTKFIS